MVLAVKSGGRRGEDSQCRTPDEEFHLGSIGEVVHYPCDVHLGGGPTTRWGVLIRCICRSKLCRSKCPKNNFDRTTSPASSHRTYPSVPSHTPKYSLVPSHEPIGFIVHTSYLSCAYANHIARMGSCGGVPNIARRTDTLVPLRGFPTFPPG